MFDPLDRAPAFRLHRVQRLLRAHLLGVLAPEELTPEQFFVLMRLHPHQGKTQRQLGDPTLDDRASVSRQVASLERRGLLRRESNPEDRRAVLVCLTQEGRALRDRLSVEIARERARLFGGLDPDDLAALHRVIDHLEGVLGPPC